jgi:hypothetical protein
VEPPPSSGPAPLGRSGQFGVGLGIELALGGAAVVAPGSSSSGFHLALALQVDMGPQAAFRLPLAVTIAGSGDNLFAYGAFVPTFIYRFRKEIDQAFIPYIGLGASLGFVEAGRHVLGRPVLGTPTADSCSSHRTGMIRDCAFTLSPAPIVGVEWHGGRLFAVDIAAAYAFAHLTSSDAIVSWVHIFELFVGPRLTF